MSTTTTVRAAIALCLMAASAWAQPEPELRGESAKIARLELREAQAIDAFRLVSEASGLNVVATREAGEKPVTIYLQETTAIRAVETICKVSGLWYRRDTDTGTLRVMTTKEFQQDHIIYRKDEIRIFTLRHPNAIAVAKAIQDLYGERVELSYGVESEETDDLPRIARGLSAGRASSFRSGEAGLFRRDVGGGRRDGFRYDRGMGPVSTRRRRAERVLDEDLTPRQIEMVEGAVQKGEPVSPELAGRISRIDPTIYLTVNRQHNLIVVRTSDADAMTQLARLVVELDRPTPQVLLEMKILELQVGEGFRSVFDVQFTGGAKTTGPATTQPPNPLLPTAAIGSRNTLGSGNFDLEQSTFVYQFLNDNVMARLQLLESENRVNVLATPILLASNNRAARLFVGEERVLTRGVNSDVIVSGTGPAVSSIEPITEIRNIGNTLVVVPKINADRTVTLYLIHDSSTVAPKSATIPVPDGSGGITAFPVDTVNTANLEATVVAKDGMTLAVGGLIRVELVDREEKVPILGDIPGLRLFFRKKVKDHVKAELILLIKPRVLFTPEDADRVTRERLKALSDHTYVKEGDAAYKAMREKVRKGLDSQERDDKKKKKKSESNGEEEK